ncbi:hypothetical protein FPE01S_05_00930 [Flavihumibacter petaseus NBRC 106054]|uniref:Uncharacterized protein n=1 Tax=Flavihumibacter petaseus NBRC 106054 TaxID=1220578 RepID=A0A0E9N650_9BACT|nr:hypothetical protein FPE01S_05_00930 [Flavihumibacter petaseus NBRC 106054]
MCGGKVYRPDDEKNPPQDNWRTEQYADIGAKAPGVAIFVQDFPKNFERENSAPNEEAQYNERPDYYGYTPGNGKEYQMVAKKMESNAEQKK